MLAAPMLSTTKRQCNYNAALLWNCNALALAKLLSRARKGSGIAVVLYAKMLQLSALSLHLE